MFDQTYTQQPYAPLNLLLAPFRSVLWFVDSMPRAIGTAQSYDRLASLSDETLANKGLVRENLPKAAFDLHFGK